MSSSVSDYSPQAVFDATVRHLAEQGRPSLRRKNADEFTCLYRGPRGAKCAVGLWILDEKYTPLMEGSPLTGSVSSRVVQEGLPEAMRGTKMLNLLDALQQAHDFGATDAKGRWKVGDMRHGLRDIARRRKLSLAVIDECFPT
jgi:hypothetical protein